VTVVGHGIGNKSVTDDDVLVSEIATFCFVSSNKKVFACERTT
jgi:hypothetical protein